VIGWAGGAAWAAKPTGGEAITTFTAASAGTTSNATLAASVSTGAEADTASSNRTGGVAGWTGGRAGMPATASNTTSDDAASAPVTKPDG
jgi:hypothetical protein